MAHNLPKPNDYSGLPRFLTVLPVYNESQHVTPVLDQVVKYATDVLVVDDGSDDGSNRLLARRDDIDVVIHPQNRGYGAALLTAFEYAILRRYDVVVTIDCDGQHEPQRILKLVEGCRQADIVSGSRYLDLARIAPEAPHERRRINQQITRELNDRLGLELTDAFCGFKAYQTRSLAQLTLSEAGYGMPLELWVQAAWHELEITEMPVPLIYLDEKRSFGGALDSGAARLDYYREVIERAMQSCASPPEPEEGSQLCEAAAWSCQ